jgi:two-component system cell cycle response regulator DivK
MSRSETAAGAEDVTATWASEPGFVKKLLRVEEAGVAMAREAGPDLVLMDVQLPKMSGLDATRALRADAATAQIPVIVVTSFALSGDDQRAMQAGASAYLAKPYSPRDLLALIRKFAPES